MANTPQIEIAVLIPNTFRCVMKTPTNVLHPLVTQQELDTFMEAINQDLMKTKKTVGIIRAFVALAVAVDFAITIYLFTATSFLYAPAIGMPAFIVFAVVMNWYYRHLHKRCLDRIGAHCERQTKEFADSGRPVTWVLDLTHPTFIQKKYGMKTVQAPCILVSSTQPQQPVQHMEPTVFHVQYPGMPYPVYVPGQPSPTSMIYVSNEPTQYGPSTTQVHQQIPPV